MIIGMALETVGIGLVIPAIAVMMESDLATAYPSARPWLNALGNPTQVQLVTGGMLVLVAVYLIKGLFLGFLFWRQTKFAFGVQAELSQRLFTTYLRQPYTFHLQRNSAQLILNVIDQVSQFTFSAMLPSMALLTEGLVLVGVASLLLVVEPTGTLIVVVLLGLSAWGFHRLVRARIDRAAVARQYHEGMRIQHLQQGLGGAKDVKLLGRETEFLAKYRFHNAQSAHGVQLQQTLQQLPRLWLEVLGAVALATVVLTLLARGRPVATIVPALGLFSAAAFRLMPSMTRILGSVQYLRSSVPVINTLHAELALGDRGPAAKGAPLPVLNTEIRLSDVTYSYPGAHAPALNGLSIVVKTGESVGFVGPSGSGKSTLVDVILGLLTPDAGDVRVDGQDVQPSLRAWQDQIGYVPQTIYLTDDTLRRNVAFGLPDEEIDDASVARAIKAAQLDAFVASLPKGLETLVGERGVRLSGGQRQRIGIARALYHDPPVLVLDEATSALDTVTEESVMEAVTALHGSKTILLVAHRLSTVEHCDRLYRLDQGRVVSEGVPHDIVRTQQAV